MESVEIMKYLVVEKGMPLGGEKELQMPRIIKVLDKILRMLPTVEVQPGPQGGTEKIEHSVIEGLYSHGIQRSESTEAPGSPSSPRPTSTLIEATTRSESSNFESFEQTHGDRSDTDDDDTVSWDRLYMLCQDVH